MGCRSNKILAPASFFNISLLSSANLGLCAYCSSAAQPPRFKAGLDKTTRRQRGVGGEAWGRALHFDRDHHIMMTKRGPKKRLYLQNTKRSEAHRIAPLRRSSLYRQQSCERLVLLALVIARTQG